MKPTNWHIRKATPADVDDLVEFNCGISRETEGKELDRTVVSRGVTRALQQGDEVVYYVAADSGPIGALMLTREWSDWRDGWIVWLQDVYVQKEHRGTGVFRSLLEHATREARKQPDIIGMRLYVETKNHTAQQVYARTGFDDPSYKVLEKIF